jgi:hypothetical protein
MKIEGVPGWPPYSIYIANYQTDSNKELKSQNIVEKLLQGYGGEYSREFDSLDLRSDSINGYVRFISEGISQAFLLAAGPAEADKESLNLTLSYEEYDELIGKLEKALPEAPNFSYLLKVAYAKGEEEAEALLQRYTADVGRTQSSVGLVKGCILATLTVPDGSRLSMPSREIIVIHYRDELEKAADIVWGLSFEISSLGMCMGEMSRLFSERKLMFDQMDASERSTQLRINEILAEMRRPVDEIQPGDLEDILKEITIQFSRLSTLASSMRRDHIKARGFHRRLRNLLKGWNESPLGESPTNSSAELERFENLMAPFGDFVERTEALMTQLNTVLDSVRTYLGIQQQKMSLMEQTSSKEQLIRLVNLQEILHKLEILIVAVYIMEMAKIAFETLIHEHELVNSLTAVFIPIALILSILISRMLHRGH